TPPDAPAAPAVTPPEILAPLEVPVPESLEAPTTVSVFLTIDEEGNVADVEVETSGGAEADQAVVSALQAARFRPAMQGETPLTVRIRYRYELVPPAPPPPPEPTTGRLVVTAVDATGVPLEGAEVLLMRGDLAERLVTDAGGVAAWDELEAGPVELRVSADGQVPTEDLVNVVAGEEVSLRLRLRSEAEAEEDGVPTFGAVATVEAPPREVTRRTIEQQELLSVAGTRGDPLRAIELLPGVARPPLASGELIVRGAAPTDTQVFLEGAPVPLLYHFGGLTSFFQGRLIERIDFYPGNFSVRYGRRIGAAIEVSVKDDRPERIGGMVDVNLIDASFLFQTPLGERGGLSVAARRSYLDAWLGPVLDGVDGLSVTAAPVYWDYQTIATFQPTDNDRLRLMVYGSSDKLRLLFQDPGDGDSSFRGGVGVRTQFHLADFAWEHEFAPGFEQEIRVNAGTTRVAFNVGPGIDFEADFININARAEWRMRLGERVKLSVGTDMSYVPFNVDFIGPPPQQSEGDTGGPGGLNPISTQEAAIIDTGGTQVRPAFYVESDLDLNPLQVILGLRTDYWGLRADPSLPSAWTVDPRVSFLASLPRDTRLKLAVGTFSQAPEFNEQNDEIGNGALDPIRAVHVTAGFDNRPAEGVQVGLEGFYKYLWDRVVSTPDGNLPRFTNDGIGRIYGLELSGRIQPNAFNGRFSGFLSYTLSRSERRDLPQDSWRLFDFDQTHIFTFSGTVRFNRGWELGATFRLVSGNPRTPVVGGVYDINADVYSGIPGAINSDRDPLFHRLDVRVQKTWTYSGGGRLSWYLDIQNAYNQQNQEGLSYNYNFTDSEPLLGLPIIPSIGIRGER
ncbi:MAG: TonB family protein, partial [Myxococcota bacterium]